MEFIEGSRGIYRPIRVLFDTPIYERALQTCWHMGSYKSQIALVTELLKLQQQNQLPSEVTAEDMTELLVEESKRTLRVQLWEFELEDFDEADVRPLLKLVWEVNTSMKMRDVEFEARRLLRSPEAAPPQFQHPKIISLAQMYARSLTEQQQEAPSSKLLGPREVVMEVVPKVLQGFWLPPPNTSFNMPSRQLCKMAVGITKAVEDRVSIALSSMLCRVPFSRSIRDDLVLSIQEKVRQGHTLDVLVKRLNCFATEVLNTIADVAAGEICALFQPQTHTKVSVRKDCIQPAEVDGAGAKTSPAEDVNEEPGLGEDSEPIREPDSAVITPPPATLATSAEPLGNITVENVSNLSLTETEEQPAPRPEPDSAVVSSPPLPLTLCDEPPVITAVQDDLTSSEPLATTAVLNGLKNSLDETEEQPAPSPEPDSVVVSPPTAPLSTSAEPPASIGLDETEEQPAPSQEPDSAVVPAQSALQALLVELPVITTVQDDLTSSAEPPADVPIHNGLTDNQDEAEQPTSSTEADSTVTSPPPAPLSPPSETPANIGLDKVQEESVPRSEPGSAVATTPPPPLAPHSEPPVITAVQNDLTSSAEPPANVPIYNGLNNNLDELEEQPTSSTEADSVVVSPAPLSTLSEPPVITTVQGDLTSSEPLATTAVHNGLNNSLDEVEEQPAPSQEPDSAQVPAQPALPDEPPVITALQDDLTTSAEPPANVPIHNGLNNNLNELEEQPTCSTEPLPVVVSPPPAPLTPPSEHPANTGLDEVEEPGSAADTTPPPPLTPTDEPPAITAVQDELIITEQSVRVDESFRTTTEVKKTQMSRISGFFRWLRRNICCCFLPEDDTEAE